VVSLLVASAALCGVLISVHAYESGNERLYVLEVSKFSGEPTETALADGYAACDWLRVKPWSRPPGPEHLGRHRERRMLVPLPAPTANVIKSTIRLYSHYLIYLDRPAPGPLTPREQMSGRVALIAWYKLCPFQQWVHRPVGGSGY
jgi:hypothetical protein